MKFKRISALLRCKKLLFSVMAAVLLVLLVIAAPIAEKYLVVDRQLDHADALILMAGEIATRIPAAAQLYREGRADKILLSNDGILGAWSVKHQRNLYQVEWAEIYLMEKHIPKEAIRKLPFTYSGTIYDAINTKEYVLANNIRKIMIVSSDYHTRRTYMTFTRVFSGQPTIIGVYPVDSNLHRCTKVQRFTIFLSEMVKLSYYGIRLYI